MNVRVILLVLAASACARAGTVTPPAAGPLPALPDAPNVPSSLGRYSEAPRNWHLLDASADGVPGISVERARRELLAGMTPRRTVIVAVIDGGVDTAHADLRANLWTNAKEVAGNARDDDANGYADDTRGWSFIGGRSGDVQWDTFELTRLVAACTGAVAGAGTPKPDAAKCTELAKELEEKRGEAEATLRQVENISGIMDNILPMLKTAIRSDTLTVENVTRFSPSTPELQQARSFFLQLAQSGITPDVVAEAKKAYGAQVKYGYNTAFDPRSIVGDAYTNTAERLYGNRNVTGPDASHGTHVAGIIGAVRDNGVGVDGVASGVQIMALRTVPDGDERDKDVANAIRYAVDNGALVINMSFGKGYSPFKKAVDDAVKYGNARGVLFVHGAGNDGEDVDAANNFPSRVLEGGGRAQNWLEVGAVSWKGADSLVASFSNYGRTMVDVFAPGVDILSTTPGGGYKKESGTSMAAPVVSGLAALIMAYYPELTGPQVRQVILASVTRHPQQMVVRPGSETGAKATFGSLSATGGIVNAYNALKMAAEMAKK